MKISELLKQLENKDEINISLSFLTPVSINTINEQSQERNKFIKNCIKMELSEIGTFIRSQMGFPEITMDTDILTD